MDKNTLLKTTYALVLPSLFFREHISSKVMLLNLVVALLFYGKTIATKSFFRNLIQSTPFLLFLLFGACVGISSLWYSSWDAPEIHFSLTWLGVGLLSYTFGQLHLIDWKKMSLYYAVTAIPVSLYVIGQYYSGANFHQALRGHVFTSILLSGHILLMASKWALYTKRFEKILGILSLVVSVYTLVVLGARTCLFALAFVFLVSMLRNNFKAAILFSLILLLSFWGLYIGNANFHERFEGFFAWNGYNPLFLRVLQWKGYLQAFGENWLFGLGHSQTLATVNQYYHDIQYEQAIQVRYHAHNQYLELMVKYGIVGLLVFLSFIGALLRVAVQRKAKWYMLWILFFLLLNLTENVAFSRNVSAVFFSFVFFSILFTSLENRTPLGKKTEPHPAEL